MEIISILSGIMLNCINLCSENTLIIVAVALTQAYFPFSQLQCLLLSSVHCLCLPIVSVSSLLFTRHICSYNEKSSAPWMEKALFQLVHTFSQPYCLFPPQALHIHLPHDNFQSWPKAISFANVCSLPTFDPITLLWYILGQFHIYLLS